MPNLIEEKANFYLTHFPQIISEELVDYVINTVFEENRYIITYKKGAEQYGYCTHCKQEFQTDYYKHNEKVICRNCSSYCVAKDRGRGRKSFLARAYFVYYEKSIIDPNVIVARGIEAYRDYRDYKNVETQYHIMTWYVFDVKQGSTMFIKKRHWEGQGYNYSQKVGCYYYKYNQSNMHYVGYSRGSIKKAVEGTSFSWSGWEKYDHQDMVKFFDLYTKYPCIEYLTKLGFTDLVRAKIMDGYTYGAVNWRGKNLFKVLKINKQQLSEIKAKELSVTTYFLHLFQLSNKRGWNLTFKEIDELERVGEYNMKELENLLSFAPIKKVLNYFSKQREKYGEHFSNYSINNIFSTWRDYIKDCTKLEIDLTKENAIFPKNLYRAHQNTIKQVKYKEDQALNELIHARLPELNKYQFSYKGLMIRPAESSKELINEGK